MRDGDAARIKVALSSALALLASVAFLLIGPSDDPVRCGGEGVGAIRRVGLGRKRRVRAAGVGGAEDGSDASGPPTQAMGDPSRIRIGLDVANDHAIR
jgi:hypothetical protein